MSKLLSWFTPPGIGVGVGYGYAAVSTIESLMSKGVNVQFSETEAGQSANVHVSFVQPDWYRGKYEQYRVGYTPWESTVLPPQWPSIMRDQNEIWTPSTFIKGVFEDNNVNEIIRVVPHGIDPEIWQIHDREVTDKFVFLHVGGPTARKGGQRVVDAFLDVFGDVDDAYLVLKSTSAPTEARWYKNGSYMGSAATHPRITNIDSYLETWQMVEMYNKAHCLVYPTNGEGFGLIPFQGIASGLPTIVTDATACMDFAQMSIPLDSHPAPGNGVHLGQWAEPDADDLRDKMRWVYDNYTEARDKTLKSARIIHSTQTWDHVADQIIEILDDKF